MQQVNWKVPSVQLPAIIQFEGLSKEFLKIIFPPAVVKTFTV